MKIHTKKCEFVVTLVVYLRHRIVPNGIMVHWAKVIAILEMPNPIDVHTLKSFIGLCNYYRIYVQDFITIALPLYALLKKDVAWTWSEEVQEVFNTFKEKLSEFLILRRPNFSKVTSTRVLLVLVLFLANLMRKVRNILSPMHPETTIRLKATTLHTKGSVLMLYGLSYISGPIFMAPNSLCIQTTSLSSG
jgi:hypothetical protein